MRIPVGRGKWRRRLKHLLVWAVLLACLAIGAGVIFFLYVPVSLKGLNARVCRQLEKASGMNVDFRRARFFGRQRRYSIENLTFSSPEHPEEPVLVLDSVDISVFPVSLILGRSAFIDSIVVRSPSPMGLVYDEKGVVPDSKLKTLLEAFSRLRQVPEKGSEVVPFRSFKVTDAQLHFEQDAGALLRSETSLTGGARQLPHSFDLKGVEVVARGEGKDLLFVEWNGKLAAGRVESLLAGTAALRLGHSAELTLDSPRIHVSQVLPGAPQAEIDVEKPHLRLLLHHNEARSGYGGLAEVSSAAFTVSFPSRDVVLRDEKLSVTLAMTYDPERGLLGIEQADVDSRMLSAETSGAFEVTPPHTFNVTLRARRMAEPYRDLLEGGLPEGYDVQGSDTSFLLDVSAKGDAAKLTSVVGKLLFTTVTIRANHFAKPLEQLSGEVDFEPQRVVLHDLTGLYGRTSINLSGQVDGDYLLDRQGTLTLTWDATSNADDLMSLFGSEAKNGRAPQQPSRGTISSSGTLEQFISLSEPGKTPPPTIVGGIAISNVAFSHQKLPVPVIGLTGYLRVQNDQVLIESLEGQAQGSTVRVEGEIFGNRYFWNGPKLDAWLMSKFDLADLVTYLPPKTRQQIARYRVRGDTQSRIHVEAALQELESASFTGIVQLRGGTFDPQSQAMNGPLTRMDADVSWDGRMLRVNKFGATINKQRLNGSAELSDDEIILRLKGDVGLGAVRQVFPKLEMWTEMEGPATCDLTCSLRDESASGSRKGEQTDGGKLVQLVTGAGTRVRDAYYAGKLSFGGRVAFGNKDGGVMLRHAAMPMAREDEGRAIPRAELRNVHGEVRAAGMTFTAAPDHPLHCDVADTPDCMVSGSYEVRPGNWPRIDFTLEIPGEARLDPWMLGWGQQVRILRGTDGVRPPPPPEGAVGKRFDLTARIRSERCVYKEQHAGPMSLTLEHIFHQYAPRTTKFEDVRLSGFGGQGNASGELVSVPWEENSPRWSARANIQHMRILPLSVCLFRNARNIDGVISTQVEVSGRGTDTRLLSGGGSASMRDVELSRSPLIRELGERTGQSFDTALFATSGSTNFTIGSGALSTNNLNFQSRGMVLEMRGDYYFDRRLNATLRVKFLESVLGQVPMPIVRDLARATDQLAGRLLEFRVTGTTTDPVLEPVLLPVIQQHQHNLPGFRR